MKNKTLPRPPQKGFLNCCFSRRQRRFRQQFLDREIKVGTSNEDFPTNQITTSRYNIFNFIPKDLLLQFSKPSNFYFLILGLLQLIPQISTSGGRPTMFLPLSIIIFISSIKEVIEDLRKHKFDKVENTKLTRVFRNGEYINSKWQYLRVGDIVRVNEGQYFPADMLILYTTGKKGSCYIETKNLDGEANLKMKYAHKHVIKDFDTIEKVSRANNTFKYEKPNDYLYKFIGSIETSHGSVTLGEQNFILRGCSLKNTDYILGVVAYTGHQNKIMLNAIKSKAKFSKLEKTMDRNLVWVFSMLGLLCLFATLYSIIWHESYRSQLKYLNRLEEEIVDFGTATHFAAVLGTWVLLISRVVPISIMVTLEMCRLFQSITITKDRKMIPQDNPDLGVSVQSPSLTEELGQVEYVLSDKTGTLTKNIMDFKAISIKGEVYGYGKGIEDMQGLPKVTNVDFWDKKILDDLADTKSVRHKDVLDCLVLLAVCHTVATEERNGEILYNAASPDELALLNFAKFVGVEFYDINEENVMTIKFKETCLQFKLLHVLEFNSNRKRMSVIVRDSGDNIILYTKGADTMLLERLALNESDVESHKKMKELMNVTEANLLEFASHGLRTLALGRRVLDEKMFMQWEKEYEVACLKLHGREEAMEELQDEIERDLELVGVTAIEDKLQDEVALTIRKMKDTGIKVWVLTGDKVETAINIGYSCGLLDDTMKHLQIVEKTDEDVARSIEEKLALVQSSDLTTKYSLVISGEALLHAMKPNLTEKIMQLADLCRVLMACRVSPKQKHLLVLLVRRVKPNATTLAIGDGANDVYMLTTANVSVGIRGLEGQQAAKASDFAIGEFKFLQRLLFYHGRENYRRNSYVILYSFYKNAVTSMVFFWYGFFSGFSGTSVFEEFSYQAYNILFTSLPIIAYAVFDKEYSSKRLIESTQLYVQGMKDKLFNMMRFWIWFSIGTFEAIILTVVSYYGYNIEISAQDSGRSLNYLGPGIMVYFCIIVLVNLRVLIIAHLHSVMLILSVIMMIAVFFVFIFGLSLVESLQIYGYFSALFGNGSFWVLVAFQIITLHTLSLFYNRYHTLSRAAEARKQKGFEIQEARESRNEELIGDNRIVLEMEKVNDRSGLRQCQSLEILEDKECGGSGGDKDDKRDEIIFNDGGETKISEDRTEAPGEMAYTGFAFSSPEMDVGLKNARA